MNNNHNDESKIGERIIVENEDHGCYAYGVIPCDVRCSCNYCCVIETVCTYKESSEDFPDDSICINPSEITMSLPVSSGQAAKPTFIDEPIEKLVDFVLGESVQIVPKKKHKKTKQQKLQLEIDGKMETLRDLNEKLLKVDQSLKQVQNQLNQFQGVKGRNKKEKIAAARKKLDDLNKRNEILKKEAREIFSVIKELNPAFDFKKNCIDMSAVVELFTKKTMKSKVTIKELSPENQEKPMQSQPGNSSSKPCAIINPNELSQHTQLYTMIDGQLFPVQLELDAPPKKVENAVESLVPTTPISVQPPSPQAVPLTNIPSTASSPPTLQPAPKNINSNFISSQPFQQNVHRSQFFPQKGLDFSTNINMQLGFIPNYPPPLLIPSASTNPQYYERFNNQQQFTRSYSQFHQLPPKMVTNIPLIQNNTINNQSGFTTSIVPPRTTKVEPFLDISSSSLIKNEHGIYTLRRSAYDDVSPQSDFVNASSDKMTVTYLNHLKSSANNDAGSLTQSTSLFFKKFLDKSPTKGNMTTSKDFSSNASPSASASTEESDGFFSGL